MSDYDVSLYPNILFHITSRESLWEILATTFKPSYARETLVWEGGEKGFAVPMVSFCDLRLSEIKKFMKPMAKKGYGEYAIGMKKDWAYSKGMNPVMYVSRSSDLAYGLNRGLEGYYQYVNAETRMEERIEHTEWYHGLLNVLRYMKNYEGTLARNGESHENYRFANEREWRYVPKFNTDGVAPIVPLQKIETQEQKLHMNRSIEAHRLHFRPSDIKFLIVQTDADVVDLLDHLSRVKEKYGQDVINMLYSRILTVEQILNDV